MHFDIEEFFPQQRVIKSDICKMQFKQISKLNYGSKENDNKKILHYLIFLCLSVFSRKKGGGGFSLRFRILTLLAAI